MKRLLVVLTIVFVACSLSFAGGQGTTMFQTLQLPFTANDGALANILFSGNSSAANNPSVLPFLKNSVILSHAVYLADTNYTTASGNLQLSNKDFINLSFLYFNYGSMDKTEAIGENEYKMLGTFDANDKLITISYSRIISSKITCGLSLKYIQQTIDDVSYSAVCAHLSGLYFFNKSCFAAFGINNFGQKVKDYNLPSDIYIGISKALSKSFILLGQLDNFYNDDIVNLKLGIKFIPTKIFLVRAGYNVPIKEEVGNNNEFLTRLSLGIGLKFKHIAIDYAWIPKGDLGSTNMFTLLYKFS